MSLSLSLTDSREIYQQWVQGIDFANHLPKSFNGQCQAEILRGPHKHQICQKKARPGKMTCGQHKAKEFLIKIGYFKASGNEVEKIVGLLYSWYNGILFGNDELIELKPEYIWKKTLPDGPTNTLVCTFQFDHYSDIVDAIIYEMVTILKHFISDSEADSEADISSISYYYLYTTLMNYFQINGLGSSISIEEGFDFKFNKVKDILDLIKNGLGITGSTLKAIRKIHIDKILIPNLPHFEKCCQENIYENYYGIGCFVRQIGKNSYILEDGYGPLASIKNRGCKMVKVMIIELN